MAGACSSGDSREYKEEASIPEDLPQKCRVDNGNLLRWKNAMAKGVLTVTLTKWTALFNRKTDKKTK
jgi:hypothetical protein